MRRKCASPNTTLWSSMSFASNWLEELVSEWLELDGFLVQVTPPVQIGRHGGRRAPDVVGARMREGGLQIRHCEAASWPAQSADELARTYLGKFSSEVQAAVAREVFGLFGLKPEQPFTYEMWVVVGGIAKKAMDSLSANLRGSSVTVVTVDSFVLHCVLPSLARWRAGHPTKSGVEPTLPGDKWLMILLDYLSRRDLLQRVAAEPERSSKPS